MIIIGRIISLLPLLVFRVDGCVEDTGFKCNSFKICRSRRHQTSPFMNIVTKHFAQCCGLCTAQKQCSSFNYDMTKGNCSLFTDTAAEGELLPSSNTLYGHPYGQMQTIYTECDRRPCGVDQVCISTKAGSDFICLQGSTCDESSLPSLPNKTPVIVSNGLTHSVAVYTCNDGYEPETGSVECSCTGSSSWTTPTLVCKGVDCGTPPPNDLQSVTSVTSSLYPAQVEYTCDSGYNSIQGSGTSFCQSDASWSLPTLVCEAVDCGTPPPLDLQSVTSVTSSLYPAQVEYTCDPGYNRTGGSGTSSCQTDASWSTPSLVCEAVDCGTPPPRDLQSVTSVTSSLYPAQVVYMCDPGYNRTGGSGTSSCQTDASWSTPSLVCEAVDCGTPPPHDLQSVTSVTSSVYPAQVEYMCDPGYNRTEGSGTSFCQTDASWSTPSLVCEEVDCGTPILDSTTIGSTDRTTVGGLLTVTCVDRFSFVGTSNTANCLETGIWEKIDGSCVSDHVYVGDWILAFRASTDTRSSIQETWLNDNRYDDEPVHSDIPPECLGLTTTPPCNQHIRSKLLTNWESEGIQWVRVLLLKDNQIRRELFFDGRDSTKTSWFSKTKLVNSSWPQLDPNHNFAMFAFDSEQTRCFEISQTWNGCLNDENWMVLVDGTGACEWDQQAIYPKIIYSMNPGPTKITPFVGFEYGDAMVVLVKRDSTIYR